MMKNNAYSKIKDALQNVAENQFFIHEYGKEHASSLHPQHVSVPICGKGSITIYPIFPGIELSFHRYLTQQANFHHSPNDHILEINYCHQGRIGWDMKNNASVYLGEGDVCLHTLSSCADSTISLPLGYYEGIACTFDLQRIQKQDLPLLKNIDFDPQMLYTHFCAKKEVLGILSNDWTRSVFSQMWNIPTSIQLTYYKLKVIELLLYLMKIENNQNQPLTAYENTQIELIREVHKFLITHIEQRFTIEELSKQFLINTSSLKAIFKAVYGQPIAAYMKEYRLQYAAKQLKESDRSILEIAKEIGYGTQGKFSKAFKEHMQLSPSQYRKTNR